MCSRSGRAVLLGSDKNYSTGKGGGGGLELIRYSQEREIGSVMFNYRIAVAINTNFISTFLNNSIRNFTPFPVLHFTKL